MGKNLPVDISKDNNSPPLSTLLLSTYLEDEEGHFDIK